MNLKSSNKKMDLNKLSNNTNYIVESNFDFIYKLFFYIENCLNH